MIGILTLVFSMNTPETNPKITSVIHIFATPNQVQAAVQNLMVPPVHDESFGANPRAWRMDH
jgi:hypothetical protein